jgi:hypothetical protein
VLVRVVAEANTPESETPNLVSLPSIAAPTACGTVPPWVSSAQLVNVTLAMAMTAITARMAYPCRSSPTMRPNVRGRLKEITSSRKISSQLVQAVGFSNGCAELTL